VFESEQVVAAKHPLRCVLGFLLWGCGFLVEEVAELSEFFCDR
jgi:hypothetical protein